MSFRQNAIQQSDSYKMPLDQLSLNNITVDKMSSDITELDKNSEAKWAETKFY
jgi:hypothetical protein